MNPPKMPLHIGDYKRDTDHLTALEHGVYLLLLMHYWSTGGLPTDDARLCLIARVTPTEWRKVKPIIAAFFKDGWKHPRVEHDLAKAAKLSEAKSANGRLGGRKAVAKLQQNETEASFTPLNHNTIEEEDSAPDGAASAGVVKFNPPTMYAFEDGIIRLTEKDFELWKRSFSALDVPAELVALSHWAGTEFGPKKWFHPVKNALAKKNREELARRKAAREPQEFKWRSGIEGVV